MYKTIITAIIVLTSVSIHAQIWERLNGNIEIDRPPFDNYNRRFKRPQILTFNKSLFLYSNGGVFRLSNLDKRWEYKNTGLDNPQRNHVVSVCVKGNEIFLVTIGNEVMKSSDSGENWIFVDSLSGVEKFTSIIQLFAVANTLYLATVNDNNNEMLYTSVNGSNWKKFDRLLAISNSQTANNKLLINSWHFESTYLSENGEDFQTYSSSGFKYRAFQVPCFGYGNYFYSFSPSDSTLTFSNDGINWETQELEKDFSRLTHYTSGDNIYAFNFDKLYKLQYINGQWKDTLLTVPPNVSQMWYTYQLLEVDSGLFALKDTALYFLGNGSSQWLDRSLGISLANGRFQSFKNLMYRQKLDKLYYSYDGTKWIESGPKNVAAKKVERTYYSKEYIFLHFHTSDSSYLYRSTDGINWEPSEIPIVKGHYIEFEAAGNNVYITMKTMEDPIGYYKKYFSHNLGRSFVESKFTNPTYPLAHANNIFAIPSNLQTQETKVLRSLDGLRWDTTSISLRYFDYLIGSNRYFYIYPFATSRHNPTSLLRSDDAINWTTLKIAGLPEKASFQSLVAIGDLLFASLSRGGVYVSEDFGVTWRSIQGDLPGEVLAYQFNILAENLYVGTAKHGLWKTSMNSLLATSREISNEASFNIYPNPSSHNVTISNLDSECIVSIYDATGQIVKAPKGEREIYIGDLPNGLYIVITRCENSSRMGKFIKK